MKNTVFIVCVILIMVSCRKDTDSDTQHIMGVVRNEHPRLFITKEDIPNIKNFIDPLPAQAEKT